MFFIQSGLRTKAVKSQFGIVRLDTVKDTFLFKVALIEFILFLEN